MRVIRQALFVSLLLLGFANEAWSQGQSANQKPAPAPNANTQGAPLGKKIDDVYRRLKESTDSEGEAIGKIKEALGGAKIKLQDADKLVDQLLDQLNKQHAAMDPNGEISKAIADLAGEAKKLADESLRDNDLVNQKRFEEVGKRLANARERMSKLYKDSSGGITQLEKSKRHISRALKAGVLEEATSQLDINLDAIEQSKLERDRVNEILNQATTGY